MLSSDAPRFISLSVVGGCCESAGLVPQSRVSLGTSVDLRSRIEASSMP